MLQRRIDMELLGVWLENIENFERTTKELKGWGELTEVILKLEGDRKDSEVLKRIQEVKSDRNILEKLENAWKDESLQEIVLLKWEMDNKLRTMLQESLQDWKGGRVPALPPDADEKNKLQYHIFVCFRRFRDTMGQRRVEWLQLYREYEGIRRYKGAEDSNFDKGVAWLSWTNSNLVIDQTEQPIMLETISSEDANPDIGHQHPIPGPSPHSMSETPSETERMDANPTYWPPI
jgi:hypothetical protein